MTGEERRGEEKRREERTRREDRRGEVTEKGAGVLLITPLARGVDSSHMTWTHGFDDFRLDSSKIKNDLQLDFDFNTNDLRLHSNFTSLTCNDEVKILN